MGFKEALLDLIEQGINSASCLNKRIPHSLTTMPLCTTRTQTMRLHAAGLGAAITMMTALLTNAATNQVVLTLAEAS